MLNSQPESPYFTQKKLSCWAERVAPLLSGLLSDTVFIWHHWVIWYQKWILQIIEIWSVRFYVTNFEGGFLQVFVYFLLESKVKIIALPCFRQPAVITELSISSWKAQLSLGFVYWCCIFKSSFHCGWVGDTAAFGMACDFMGAHLL